MWAWRRLQQPTKMPGCIFVARFRPALSRPRFARTVELGNTLGVGRGRQRHRQAWQGRAGHDRKQRRRARPYDQFRPARSRLQRRRRSAGCSIGGDRATTYFYIDPTEPLGIPRSPTLSAAQPAVTQPRDRIITGSWFRAVRVSNCIVRAYGGLDPCALKGIETIKELPAVRFELILHELWMPALIPRGQPDMSYERPAPSMSVAPIMVTWMFSVAVSVIVTAVGETVRGCACSCANATLGTSNRRARNSARIWRL
jgi:hypothetical protein